VTDGSTATKTPFGPFDLAPWRPFLRVVLSGLGLGMLVLVYSVGLSMGRPGFDFFAYWAVDPRDPYRIPDGLGAFHYAPPVLWFAQPFHALSFEAGYVVWTVLMAALLIWMTRSWALAWCAFPPVATEFFHGNVDLLLAAALMLGFRASPAWVVLPLTKITTGINLLWPLLRREVRSLAWVVIAGTLVVAISVLLQGADVWRAWIQHLVVRMGRPEAGGALIDVSVWLRLPVAIVVMVWASLTTRRWAVPIAVALAMPLLWFHALSVLVAIQPLWRRSDPRSAAASA
jgi:hypothetical protein